MRTPRNKFADHAVAFINNLTHTGDYSGQPFKLRKWQERIVRLIFGTRDRKKQQRQFQRVFIMLPTGNGKTELCAAILLYCLFTWPPGQQIYSAALDVEQASLIFKAARQMVEADPFLSSMCEIVPSRRRIVVPDKHSFYCALAKGTDSRQGLAPSLVLFDEVHALGAKDELWQILQAKMAKRRNPLWIGVTTAGIADPHHLAYQEFLLAKRIADGEVEHKHYLPILYYADPDEDWTDETVWKRCNPALGDFKNIDALRQECKIAQELTSRQNHFRREHLNQFVNQAERWIDMDLWDRNAEPANPEALAGRECYAGLDLAPVRDLSSLSLLFPEDNGTYKVLNYSWCCADDIQQRSKRDGVPYDRWAQTEWLTTTPGASTDFEAIRRDINKLADQFAIKVIAADQAHAYQLGQQLSEQDGIPVEWHRQGFLSMGPPTARMEKLLIDRRLHHGGNPVLRWSAGNVTVETDAVNNLKPSKKKSTERIDPVVSLIMSIGAMMLDDNEDSTSVYEERPMLVF